MAEPLLSDPVSDAPGPDPSGLAEQAHEAVLRAIIRAAAKVLERTNGESLTVQEVADEAGQSLRTLYQYFASKDDLLLAVYEEAVATHARILVAAIAPLEAEPMQVVGRILPRVALGIGRERLGMKREHVVAQPLVVGKVGRAERSDRSGAAHPPM